MKSSGVISDPSQRGSLESELQHFRTENTAQRFTVDGTPALEQRLHDICSRVLERVQQVIPARKLEALILGGGYGRGEGGVFKSAFGEVPYNDLEFYVFLRGNRLLNERRYQEVLRGLEVELSPEAGVHVEFKIDSFERFRRSPVSMFSYDLVAGHRTLFAPDGEFPGCAHHLEASRIPLHEATRLLMNRYTGLLMVMEIVDRQSGGRNDEQFDFVERNLAKAQLAMGDAVLTAFGEYHWSCIERHSRICRLAEAGKLPFDFLRRYHATGKEFKLHPIESDSSEIQLRDLSIRIASRAYKVWSWLESRRLGREFASPEEYAFAQVAKCPECSPLHAFLVNCRTFGMRSLFDRQSFRYPRERLLNSLPLLLWQYPSLSPETTRFLQNQLRSNGSDWHSLVAAYKAMWPRFS